MVQPAFADGIIIPSPTSSMPEEWSICPPHPSFSPNLPIGYSLSFTWMVNIGDQVAVTHIDQVFHNSNSCRSRDLRFSHCPRMQWSAVFTLWDRWPAGRGQGFGCQPGPPDIRGKSCAICATRPLLEYIGRGAVQAHIFPIQPGEDRRIELSITRWLTAEGGWCAIFIRSIPKNFPTTHWICADQCEGVCQTSDPGGLFPEQPQSMSPVREILAFQAPIEASNVRPDADFALYYSLGSTEAFHLLSYRDPGDEQNPDGFFHPAARAKAAAQNEVIGKDVNHGSGSFGQHGRRKFQQPRRRLPLYPAPPDSTDRFYVSAFSSGFRQLCVQPEIRDEVDQP